MLKTSTQPILNSTPLSIGLYSISDNQGNHEETSHTSSSFLTEGAGSFLGLRPGLGLGWMTHSLEAFPE